jgi:hypothetical protein
VANILQNRRQLLKKAGIFGGLAALFIPAQAIARAAETTTASAKITGTTNANLGGSWNVKVNPKGSGTPPPFQGLHTFTGDGTTLTTEQHDMVSSTPMSPGHGSWVKVQSNDGRDDFAYNYQKLVVDSQGNLLGKVHVHVNAELSADGQTFTGKGTWVFQPVSQPPNPDYIFELSASRI